MKELNSYQTQQVSGGQIGVVGIAVELAGMHAGYHHLGFVNTVLVAAGGSVLATAVAAALDDVPYAFFTAAPPIAMTWIIGASAGYLIGSVVAYCINPSES